MADANLGLGLYNYYVDTLSAMAKVLRFFMASPAGTSEWACANWRRRLQRAN